MTNYLKHHGIVESSDIRGRKCIPLPAHEVEANCCEMNIDMQMSGPIQLKSGRMFPTVAKTARIIGKILIVKYRRYPDRKDAAELPAWG